MADIFISYAEEDRSKVRPLANALEAKGRSVWWDWKIPIGETWIQTITKELKNARCVVVLWSKSSVDSHWVLEEAEDGRKREILVPAMIDDLKPPLGFSRLQTAQLIDWQSEPTHPEFEKLLKAIEKIIGPLDRFDVMVEVPEGEFSPAYATSRAWRVAHQRP